MQDLIITNYKDYIGKSILEWNIENCIEYSSAYTIVLKLNDSQKIFHIRRDIIKASDLRLNEDVYELWYKDFEDSCLLNSADILNINIVISKMTELVQKYSSYE